MDCYRITVRQDDYDEAFQSVGRYLRGMNNKEREVTIIKEADPVYFVRMPFDLISVIRKHGDVVEVTGTL